MSEEWTTVIEPRNKLWDLKIKEIWTYKDLISLFVQRDFKTKYKQTVLGPLWFVIQPIFTTVIHTIVFGNLAGLSTNGTPKFLFYMIGNLSWLYFSSCIMNTSNTFVTNAAVFGKVYFPRLTTPIATVISTMINFFVQFIMFILFEVYYLVLGANVCITRWAIVTPILIAQMALLSMGFGIIISSLTTKYRDLQVLVSFGVSLWMYMTPVIYSASTLSSKAYKILMLNPIAPIVELMRYGWLGVGEIDLFYWAISWITTCVVLVVGMVMFNKVEKTFMDTV